MLKTFSAQIASVVRSRHGKRNIRTLFRFLFVLTALIVLYTVVFHLLMLREGQEFTWITGFYWTLTVMSTLGFGDITFHTDIGRLFSILVLMSGMVFLLVLFPFTFIEFFYEPWMKAQAAARAPRQLPQDIRGHVLLTKYDAVTGALIHRLDQYEYPYAMLVPDVEEALRLHDLDVNVMVGNPDDPEAWQKARVETAALVASTASDAANTNVAFTVRALAPTVPIMTTASDEASIDILSLAGSNHVLRLAETIGQSFARRTVGGDAMSHVIGRFDDLLIAEASAHRTPLAGRTIGENDLVGKVGASVVGVWQRGQFAPARSETMIQDNTLLVLAGTEQQLQRYDELFCIYNATDAPVVILGGGRVGRATARILKNRDLDYRIVEPLAERIRDPETYVRGSAADLAVLEKAGIRDTTTVVVTTHDDDLNVYLTIYCRQLRPDVQILSRATHERNVATLHRAGADSVLSYASMGTSAIMNVLRRNRFLTITEGLDLFELRVPDEIAGRTIAESGIREQTGCSVVAFREGLGMKAVMNSSAVFPRGAEMLLIGTDEAEDRFLARYAKEGGTSQAS